MRNRQLPQRPETFILNSNHQLITGLRYAACGNSPYTTIYCDSGPYKYNGVFTLMDPPKNWVWDAYLNRFVIDLNYSGAGANDRVYLSPAVVSTNTFTFSAWLKPMSSVDQYGTIFAQGATRGFYYHGTNDATNNLKIDWYNAGSNFCTTLFTNLKWNHIAAIMKNGTTIDFYINGKYSNTTSGTYYATTFDNIGDDPSTETYTGSIADIMLWDIVLNSYQIQQLANPYNTMLDGLIKYPKRQLFAGYTLPNTTTYIARQQSYTKVNKRPDDFVIDTDHSLANGLIFAGCGKSPGSATYVDSSIYQTNGILTTMTPTIDWVWDDKIGQWVLEFDGSDDYVSVLSNPSFRLAGNKSLCCWVKMPSLSTGCGFAGKSNSISYGMALGYGWNGNGFMALCWNSSNSPWLARDATRDYEWCHLSAVQHGTTRYIYVWDSQGLRTSSSVTGTHSWDHADPFRIGDAGAQKPPAGTKIGSVLVYNRALSMAETKVLANPYDPMMDGLLRSAKRKIYAGIYIAPSSTEETVVDTSSKVIVKRRGKKITERPETFNVDYNNPLAHGLVFASLGNSPSSAYSSDSSLYNTPGILVGSVPAIAGKWSAQLNRRFLQFAGTTSVPQYSAHPSRAQYNLVTQGTIAFWARAELLDNSLQDCIIKGGASWAVNDWSVWFSSNQFGGNIANGTSALSTSGPRTPTITDSTKFNHVCFTWYFNGTQSVTKMYFNGILNQTVNTAIIPQDRLYTFGIARDNEYNGYYFVGGMADIMLYNRDLTALEVNQLGDASNSMLSGMLQSSKRQYYPVYKYSPPVVGRARFIRLSTHNRRSLFLWK